MNFSASFSGVWAEILRGEWSLWARYYLPADVKGKTVLDIGAGQGETALFYLLNGAKKVIAIQPDWDPSYGSPLPVLKKNAETMGNVEVIGEFFRPSHLDIEHDVLKMDCEGQERLLYERGGELAPCVIEAHGNDIADELCRRFRLKRVYPLSHDRYNIWLLHKSTCSHQEFIPQGDKSPEEDDPEYLSQFEP